MRVAGDSDARDLRADIRAPRISVREEESLAVSPAVRALVVERLAFLLQRRFQSGERQVDAAIIRGVFSLGEQAVLLDSGTGVGNFLGVFVRDALAALVVLF